MIHWTDKYIGVPYSQYDCAEFVEYVARSELGLETEFPKTESRNLVKRNETLKGNLATFVTRIEQPEDKQPVLMSIMGVFHAGLCAWINEEWWLLHNAADKKQSCLTRLDIYQKYIVGYYRFKDEVMA
jgi:hypothetical protein